MRLHHQQQQQQWWQQQVKFQHSPQHISGGKMNIKCTLVCAHFI